MVYHVGRPAMFDGNMFLPEMGTPIWKMARSSTWLAVWLPDPFTVATEMLKSLTTFWEGVVSAWVASAMGELISASIIDHVRHRPADVGRAVDYAHSGIGEGR